MFDITLSDNAVNFLNIVISIIIAFAVKDLASKLISGWLFKFDPFFQEGDVVYLDDRMCIINKIGIFSTTFQENNGRGIVWVKLDNDRLRYHKLEKVLVDCKHCSDEEKG